MRISRRSFTKRDHYHAARSARARRRRPLATGERALANCQRLIDMARHFEGGASSFRAFVERLEADAERGEADEAPIVEEVTREFG